MRRVVDFPHPEAPTRTVKEPSRMSRFRSSMTTSLPYAFVTFFKEILLNFGSLPLDLAYCTFSIVCFPLPLFALFYETFALFYTAEQGKECEENRKSKRPIGENNLPNRALLAIADLIHRKRSPFRSLGKALMRSATMKRSAFSPHPPRSGAPFPSRGRLKRPIIEITLQLSGAPIDY